MPSPTEMLFPENFFVRQEFAVSKAKIIRNEMKQKER